MTNQHPITPSPELVARCRQMVTCSIIDVEAIAEMVARWGADQELEACCTAIDKVPGGWADSRHLRHVRRPKPPSLKEQALEALEHILHNSSTELGAETIRRALEALDD